MTISLPTPRRRRAVCGFTLVELMFVVAILAILMAILLPTLAGARDKARAALARAQVQSIGAACESYDRAYGAYPGYYSDETIWADYENITSSENLVISLLGGATSATDTTSPYADPDKIGFGPVVTDLSGNDRVTDPFYSPKENELGVATGTLGSDNDIPDLLDLYSGMPILYYRAAALGHVPVAAAPGERCFNDSAETFKGSYYRRINADFTEAPALQTPAQNVPKNNAENSLIADTFYTDVLGIDSGDMNHKDRYGNRTFAAFLAHRGKSYVKWHNANGIYIPSYGGNRGALKGGFALVAAGSDGIYFNKDDAGEEGKTRSNEYAIYLNPPDYPTDGGKVRWGILDDFNDTVYVSGRTPD